MAGRDLESDDVPLRAVFNQIAHPKIISVILHKIEFRIVVGVDSLMFCERLDDFLGQSGSWISCSVALKLSKPRRQSDTYRSAVGRSRWRGNPNRARTENSRC